jgi:hypothetical protein
VSYIFREGEHVALWKLSELVDFVGTHVDSVI